MTLDTDYNTPVRDFRLDELKVIADDHCQDSLGRDYELRHIECFGTPTPTYNPVAPIIAYPVPGLSMVYWIASVDRETACPERMWFQHTEAECARASPPATSLPADPYLPDHPTFARITFTDW